MKKLMIFGLLLVLFLPCNAWPEPTHEAASQGAVSLAMRNPWPHLPAPGEIDAAFKTYQGKLGKNASIASGPTRMYVPWETDPLTANKVVLTVRSKEPGRDSVAVLKYDFLSSTFKFDGMLLPGIKRYAGDRSTASFLEPQDLKYLKSGWLAYGNRKGTSPDPDDVADLVEEYIRQFENDSCFGRVISLGDPARFREALNRNLTIISKSTAISSSALASHVDFKTNWAITPPPAELRVPFAVPVRPRRGEMSHANLQTLYHESIHHLEWLNGAKRPKGTAGSERNTDYLDQLVNALKSWRKYEREAREGKRTAAQTRVAYGQLVNAFEKLEKDHHPELANLEKWGGIRIRLADIRALYLNMGCGPALRDLAANFVPGDPNMVPVAGDEEDNTPPSAPPAAKTSSAHIVYAMVYDNATGRPVEGAAFTVLKPGVTTREWVASGHDMKLVAAMGVSNAGGMVTLSNNLMKGKTYSFMVAGIGYKTITYEKLAITDKSREPLKITVKMSR